MPEIRDSSPRNRAPTRFSVYRVLFDHLDNMVCTLDLDGRVTRINPAGERLTGYSGGELAGTFAVQLITPEHRDEVIRQFERRLETTDLLPAVESVLLTRDGTCVPIE